MNMYRIYLFDKKHNISKEVANYTEKHNAIMVAKALKPLVEEGTLTHIYNDFHEPFDLIEVEEYEIDFLTGKKVYSSEE